MTYVVYAITDPKGGRVRYVGCTEDLEQRMSDHSGCIGSEAYGHRPLYVWLGELRAAGSAPGAIVLAFGIQSVAEARCVEAALIAFHHQNGAVLFNVQGVPKPPAPANELSKVARELSKRGHAVRWADKTAERKRQATEAARAARWRGKK